MKENFGTPGFETSWFPFIRSVHVEGTTLVVRAKTPDDRPVGAALCRAASGYVYGPGNAHRGLDAVKVNGPYGTLVHRRSLGERCE